MNGSVDRLAEALRDVFSEAVEKKVEEKLEPIRQQLERRDTQLKQHGVLLRAIAGVIVPEETLAAIEQDKGPLP